MTLSENFRGLQHIGISANDIEQTIPFISQFTQHNTNNKQVTLFLFSVLTFFRKYGILYTINILNITEV